MRYRLNVIWKDGTINDYQFGTIKEATRTEKNLKMVFGIHIKLSAIYDESEKEDI